jgi:ABC-2 type transport system permease protein
MKKFIRIKKIFIRELRLVSKDINIISVVLLAPLFYSFFYGTIYYNKVETNIGVVVMDFDNSATSNKLIRYLNSHQSVSIVGKIEDLEEGNKKLISEEAKAIVYFPKGFEETLKKGKRAEIKIYLNGTRFLVSNDLNKAINEVIGYVNAGISLKYFETKGYNFDQAVEIIDPIKLDVRSLFNFTESYGDFLIPAVLVLILQQTLLIGLSESIAKERETNSFDGLSRLANWQPNLLIHGKGLFYFLLFGSYGVFFFIINFSVFKIPNRGEFLPLFIFTTLLLISVIYISIFVSSFFHRKIISLQFLTLTSYPVFLISGYSWLYQSLPVYLKILTNIIPSTPYFAAFTRITQMGAGLNEVLPELIHLIILAIAGYTLTYFRINKLMKTSQTNVYSINTSLKIT